MHVIRCAVPAALWDEALLGVFNCRQTLATRTCSTGARSNISALVSFESLINSLSQRTARVQKVPMPASPPSRAFPLPLCTCDPRFDDRLNPPPTRAARIRPFYETAD